MRDHRVKLIGGYARLLAGVGNSRGQGVGGEFIDFLAVLQEEVSVGLGHIHLICKALVAEGIYRMQSPCRKVRRTAPVRRREARKQGIVTLFENDCRRRVAEEYAGRAVAVVGEFGKLLGRHYQRVLYIPAGEVSPRHVNAVNEARAGAVYVDGGAARHAQLPLYQARLGGGVVIGSAGGADDEPDIGGGESRVGDSFRGGFCAEVVVGLAVRYAAGLYARALSYPFIVGINDLSVIVV